MLYDSIDFEILNSVFIDYIQLGAYCGFIFAIACIILNFMVRCFSGRGV